jgi:hypothetical protein
MGFVYNKPTEAMAKTYLEMNGFLVQNDLFTDLLSHPDGRSYRFEADLIGYKPPNTTIFREHGGEAPVDKRSGKQTAAAREFFAGDNAEANWVYCELKANFLDGYYSTQVKNLAIVDKAAVEHKRGQIARRLAPLEERKLCHCSRSIFRTPFQTRSRFWSRRACTEVLNPFLKSLRSTNSPWRGEPALLRLSSAAIGVARSPNQRMEVPERSMSQSGRQKSRVPSPL